MGIWYMVFDDGFALAHCFGQWFGFVDGIGSWFGGVTLHIPNPFETSAQTWRAFGDHFIIINTTLEASIADVDRVPFLRGLFMGYLMYLRWTMYLILLFYWRISFSLLVLVF